MNQSYVDTQMVARINYVLKPFHLNVNEWSLALEGKSYAWRAGYVSLQGLLLQFLAKDLAKEYPMIEPGISKISVNHTSQSALKNPLFSDKNFIDELKRRHEVFSTKSR